MSAQRDARTRGGAERPLPENTTPTPSGAGALTAPTDTDTDTDTARPGPGAGPGPGTSSSPVETARSQQDSDPGTVRGVGPWPGGRGSWPDGEHLDPELLESGDHRNVEDRYRYWRMSSIREDLRRRSRGFEIAVENLGHDFNIGSIVRTANALGASRVHVVGRRRWNRRGAMVTDRYMDVDHLPDAVSLATDARERGLTLVGIDNVEGSEPLEGADLPERVVLVFGEESGGLSDQMLAECDRVLHISQHGSTRSMNVGHAAAIAMWAWVTGHEGLRGGAYRGRAADGNH